MTSRKVNIDEANENISSNVDDAMKKVVSSNHNYTRNLIAMSIQVSGLSKVPMMIVGNPGEGKTCTIDDYAQQYGYHVEKLIGSQYSQDDVLGYQVNTGDEYLKIIPPEWYKNIMEQEKKGVPTILFLDELVTASVEVQEALLGLTSERTLRGGRKLPDDCIVMSAINYKDNLPPENNLTATQLNRFCLINVLPGDMKSDPTAIATSWVDDVTQGFSSKDIKEKLPKWNAKPFTESENTEFLMRFRGILNSLFREYVGGGADRGALDLRNTHLDGMFEGHASVNSEDNVPEIYNFISKRSVSYLMRVLRSLCEIGIDGNSDYWKKFVVGLVGLGTNNWDDNTPATYRAQITKFHKCLYTKFSGLISDFSHTDITNTSPKGDKINVEKLKAFDQTKLSGEIKSLIAAKYSSPTSVPESSFLDALKDINKTFPTNEDAFVKKITGLNKDNVIEFRTDYEAVNTMYSSLADFINDNMRSIFDKAIKDILMKYEMYYSTSLNGLELVDIRG